MDEYLIQNVRTYAAQHQLCLAERLGFGIHGMVFVAENNTKPGKTAVKVHRAVEPFQRECAVYERLRAAGVSEVLGFNVPQLIRADDKLLVVEMTVVARPFVLDFAGAYLDTPPDEIEAALRKELVLALYQRRVLLMAKAAALAQISRWEFEELLCERHVERPFSEDDLAEDLKFAREHSRE